MHLRTTLAVVCFLLFSGVAQTFAQSLLDDRDILAVVASGGTWQLADADRTNQDATGVSPASAVNMESAQPFAQGQWVVYGFGSALLGFNDDGDMFSGHVGGGYYLLDGLSLNFEAFGAAVDGRDREGAAAGFDLIIRWHWLTQERWSIYLEGGAGLQQATFDFPSDSHNNFRPQIGLGATYQLDDRLLLMGGMRFVHISNAGRTQENQGLEGLMPYLGLMYSF